MIKRATNKYGMAVTGAAGSVIVLALVGLLVLASFTPGVSVSHDISYGDVAVGVGTLILAVATLGSVVVGWQALKDNRREIDAQHRPVLVPIVDTTVSYQLLGTMPTTPARPAAVNAPFRPPALYIPVENIGVGPAINIVANVSRVTGDERIGGPWDPLVTYQGFVASLAVRDPTFVQVPMEQIQGVPEFELVITYEDIASRLWETTAYFMRTGQAGARAYVDLRVGEYSGPPTVVPHLARPAQSDHVDG